MSVIQWVQYNERVVGENSPVYPDDVDNRPLKQVLSLSGYASNDDFIAFMSEYTGAGSPEAVVASPTGRMYFRTDGPPDLYVKRTGVGNTGWFAVGSIGPGTIRNYAMFTPTGSAVGDGLLRQVVGPPIAIIVGATDPEAAANETFRTGGGIISESSGADSTILGRAALNTGIGGISIGHNAIAGATGNPDLRGSIVIGRNSILNSTTSGPYTADNQACVIIGPENTRTVSSTQPTGYDIIIGAGNVMTSSIGGTAFNNTLIGYQNAPGNASNGIIVLGSNFAGSSQLGQVIIIGNSIGHAATSVQNIMIGGASNLPAGGGNCIIIGFSASVQGGAGSQAIAIGQSSRVDNDYAIAIGGAARSRGAGSIAIGRSSDTGAFTDIAVFGTGAIGTGNNQVIFSSNFTGADFRTFVFGNRGEQETTNSMQPVTWRITNAITTANLAAKNLTIQAGLSTGNAVGGDLNLAVGLLQGAGSTQHVAYNAIRVIAADANNAYVAINSPASRNPAFQFEVAGAIKGYIGTAGVAGGIITNSAVGDICIRSQGGLIIFSVTSGASIQWAINAAGHLVCPVDNTYDIGSATGPVRPKDVRIAGSLYTGVAAFFIRTTTALTNGAGAGAGTITNAPAAGNPTKWVGIDDNGTTRYVPAW